MAGASSLNDIREWGRQNGFDVTDDKALPRGLRSAYQKRDDTDVITRIVPDEEEGTRVLIEDGPEPVSTERPPAIRHPSVVQRARSLVGKKVDDAPKVRSHHPRRSVDRIIERVWEGMARLVQPVNLPVARVMAVQAPVAGLLLEDIVKGTVVDRVLQPIVRVEEKG